MATEETDIVIVGGGVPGLVMAVEAFRRGLAACVLEREPEASPPPRGAILQPAALASLAKLELYDALRSEGAPIERIELQAVGATAPAAVLDYAEIGLPFPFALGVSPEAVGRVCKEALVRYQAVSVVHGAELLALHHERGRVDGAVARVPAGEVTYRARMVVVTTLAGGAPVRAEIGAALRPRPYPEELAGLVLPRPEGWPATLAIWLGAGIGVWAYPLSDRLLRIESLATGGLLSGAKAQGPEAIRRLLAPLAPPLESVLKGLRSAGDVFLTTPVRARPRRRLADAVAVTGPAAAAMSPAGFNVETQAVLDAAALATALSRSAFTGDFSRLALLPYEQERSPLAQRAASLAHDLHRLSVSRRGLHARARGAVLDRLGRSPLLRLKLLRALAALPEPWRPADRLRLAGLLPLPA